MIANGKVQRDEVLIATKGGFLNFDGDGARRSLRLLPANVYRTGLLRPKEVVAGCHVMSPKYLENQIDVSRRNLGVETLDIYYLHNPETQSANVAREEFDRRIRAAFAALEKAVARRQNSNLWHGNMECVTVWGRSRARGFRFRICCASLRKLAARTIISAPSKLPYNLAMPEALSARTQRVEGKGVPVLQVARAHGMLVFASCQPASAKIGEEPAGGNARVVSRDAEGCAEGHPVCALDARNFVRAGGNEPQPNTLRENLATALTPPLNLEQFRAIFNQ